MAGRNRPAYYYFFFSSNHPLSSSMLTSYVKIIPSFSSAPLQLSARLAFVFPYPLPPDVAKGTIAFQVKSCSSRNVLTIVGAFPHQIGKPSAITS